MNETPRVTSQLKQEAENILGELSLIGILKKYGEARVVGSVALDLIVKRDVDIHVLVEEPYLLDVADRIYHELVGRGDFKEIRISDYSEREGMLVAIDNYPGTSGGWSIDIWVTNNPERTGFALYERLNSQLNPEHRKEIMEIKEYYHQQGQLRDSLSTAIYEAVIDAGVWDLNRFREYLAKRRVNIDKEKSPEE